MNSRNLAAITGLVLAVGLSLTACGSTNPLATPTNDKTDTGTKATIVVGSQDYYSNEIIAEVYAQSLEADGYTVDRQLRIGQREVYLPEIEAGRIDLFPEYTGPLLKFWDPNTTAKLSDEIYADLKKVTPEGLRVLDEAPATDQDSYVVTKEFAEKWGLKTIEDLSKVTTPMTMGANSEAEDRPNGPKGLKDTYGVDVGFTPIEDGGGPLTVKALHDGDIQIAIIYSADPTIQQNDLVSLEDTKGLFLASHVVPLASNNVDDEAAKVINAISAQLTSEALVHMNARSVEEELPAKTIAKEWLASLS